MVECFFEMEKNGFQQKKHSFTKKKFFKKWQKNTDFFDFGVVNIIEEQKIFRINFIKFVLKHTELFNIVSLISRSDYK